MRLHYDTKEKKMNAQFFLNSAFHNTDMNGRNENAMS
jgi:hypothetical protein